MPVQVQHVPTGKDNLAILVVARVNAFFIAAMRWPPCTALESFVFDLAGQMAKPEHVLFVGPRARTPVAVLESGLRDLFQLLLRL